ncbi:unnamed protein product [Umbelopsis sp. WA50703]
MNVQTPANRSTAVCFLRRSEGEIAFTYYATDAGGAPDVLNGNFQERRAAKLASRPSSELSFVTEMLAEKRVPEATLSVSLIDQDSVWVGFIYQDTLFVRASSWKTVDVRESIMAVMELAETLECENVAFCVPKTANEAQHLIRDLLMVGFELIHPAFKQLGASVQEKYICVGMEA